jgi:hypothetical protein
LADKSTQLVLDGLGRGLVEPAGFPLHGTKAVPGLFPSTAAGKRAAQRCLNENWIRFIRTVARGRTTVEVCAVTDSGLAFLMSQVSPKQVLEDLVRALEARQGQVSELEATAEQTQNTLKALKGTAAKVLQEMHRRDSSLALEDVKLAALDHPSSASWTGALLDHLTGWQRSKPFEDCPLPDLYRQALSERPLLTIGHFHDGLRALHEREEIYLHPWTGPLYQIPEPPFALLIGHEIAYYASRRCA